MAELSDKLKIRLGVRIPGTFFPHAATFVIDDVPRKSFDELGKAFDLIRGILRAIGKGDVADQFILEEKKETE